MSLCNRRERWLTPDGRTVVAPLPAGISGHFGPELRRFVLMQYHQGQSLPLRSVPRARGDEEQTVKQTVEFFGRSPRTRG